MRPLKIGLVLAALALTAPPALAQRGVYRVGPTYHSPSVGAAGSSLPALRVSNDPVFWEQERKSALERMDQALEEKALCKTKYMTRSYARDCELSADKLRAYWNDRALEAGREAERRVTSQDAQPVK